MTISIVAASSSKIPCFCECGLTTEYRVKWGGCTNECTAGSGWRTVRFGESVIDGLLLFAMLRIMFDKRNLQRIYVP
jgi:hypothetical protein